MPRAKSTFSCKPEGRCYFRMLDGSLRRVQYRIVHYNCTKLADLGEATADTPPLQYLKDVAHMGNNFTHNKNVEFFNNHKDVAECTFPDANGRYTVQCRACKRTINVTGDNKCRTYPFLEHSLFCMKLQAHYETEFNKQQFLETTGASVHKKMKTNKGNEKRQANTDSAVDDDSERTRRTPKDRIITQRITAQAGPGPSTEQVRKSARVAERRAATVGSEETPVNAEETTLQSKSKFSGNACVTPSTGGNIYYIYNSNVTIYTSDASSIRRLD